MMRVRMKLFNGNFALASSVDNGLKLNLQDVMALMSLFCNQSEETNTTTV